MFIGLYLSYDLNLTTAFMFIFGMSAIGRSAIGFLYLMELLPSNTQVIAGTALHIHNTFTGLIGCLYFWLISKNWIYLGYWGCATGVLGLVAVLFMPESPKFLISVHKYEEARAAINHIARYNKQPEFTGKFDREIAYRNRRNQNLNMSQTTEATFISSNDNA
jgi:hypothetical protein